MLKVTQKHMKILLESPENTRTAGTLSVALPAGAGRTFALAAGAPVVADAAAQAALAEHGAIAQHVGQGEETAGRGTLKLGCVVRSAFRTWRRCPHCRAFRVMPVVQAQFNKRTKSHSQRTALASRAGRPARAS